MKLKELFEQLINEDRAISFEFNEKDLPDFTDVNTAKKIGTSENYDIWGSRYYGENLDAYGILDSENSPLALLIIETKEKLINGKRGQEINKLWVRADHRGKALAMALLCFVIRKTKTALFVGSLVSKDGEQLLKKIIDKKAFDVEVDDNKGFTNIIPADLFDYPNNYKIILEKDLNYYNLDSHLFEPKFKALYQFNEPGTDWD